MAFTIQNWARSSVSANEPVESVTPGGGAAVYWGSFREYNYYSPTDSQAVVAVSGYFNNVVNNLVVGDSINVYSASESSLVRYLISSVANNVVTLSLSGQLLKLQGVISSANFIGSSNAPVAIIPAPGANKIIVVEDFVLQIIFAGAQYTGGNPVGLEYTNTADLGGTAASATIAAAAINGVAANSSFIKVEGTLPIAVVGAVGNQGIFLSYNDGGGANVFATGSGTFAWMATYSIMSYA